MAELAPSRHFALNPYRLQAGFVNEVLQLGAWVLPLDLIRAGRIERIHDELANPCPQLLPSQAIKGRDTGFFRSHDGVGICGCDTAELVFYARMLDGLQHYLD